MSRLHTNWTLAINVPRARKRLMMSRLARRHPGRPIAFTDDRGRCLLVSRDCSDRTRWRVTYFDDQLEPIGHSTEDTQCRALKLALDFGADPTSFCLELNHPRPPSLVSFHSAGAVVPPAIG